MRQTLLAAAFVLLAAPAHSQGADRAGIESTILGQIEAFRADDFATAFTFAAPNIKGIFRTPENFGAMVRNGYPMVHRPGSVRMLELREVAGALWQRVMVTDAEGRTHLLDYQMLATPDGWQINGVQLLKAAGVGA
ncbi:MAG: DUF4864 domain-containing protein [Paracoccaceae bacterium]|nr:MAG: DUF4864 domain-containing protein [Paracoccaceae bacterium]